MTTHWCPSGANGVVQQYGYTGPPPANPAPAAPVIQPWTQTRQPPPPNSGFILYPGQAGHEQFLPAARAQLSMHGAPYPTNPDSRGVFPHGYANNPPAQFPTTGLPIIGHNQHGQPVHFALYPVNSNYAYGAQYMHNGNLRFTPGTPVQQQDRTAHRYVADAHLGIHGVVSHPPGGGGQFQAATWFPGR
jgi:hypothetical protein